MLAPSCASPEDLRSQGRRGKGEGAFWSQGQGSRTGAHAEEQHLERRAEAGVLQCPASLPQARPHDSCLAHCHPRVHVQVGGDVIPTDVRWYSTRGLEHRPVATTVGTGAVRWENAAVCPTAVEHPFTVTVDGGGLTVSQGPKVLFTAPSYGRPTLIAFRNASLGVEFTAAAGGGSVPEGAPAHAAGGARRGPSRSAVATGRGSSGGVGGVFGSRWQPATFGRASRTVTVTPAMTARQAEADARKRKTEARRAERAARKAAAAAVKVEYDSDTEDLLRLGALARSGGRGHGTTMLGKRRA